MVARTSSTSPVKTGSETASVAHASPTTSSATSASSTTLPPAPPKRAAAPAPGDPVPDSPKSVDATPSDPWYPLIAESWSVLAQQPHLAQRVPRVPRVAARGLDALDRDALARAQVLRRAHDAVRALPDDALGREARRQVHVVPAELVLAPAAHGSRVWARAGHDGHERASRVLLPGRENRSDGSMLVIVRPLGSFRYPGSFRIRALSNEAPVVW